MAALALKRGARRSVPVGRVRVDWSHPLARDLVACYLPGASGGINIALPGVCDLAPAGTFTVAPMDVRDEGPTWLATKAADGLQGLAPALIKTWTAFSIYWRGWNGGTTSIVTAGLQYSNPETAPYVIGAIGISSGPTVGAFWNNSGTFASGTFVALSPGYQGLGATFKVGGSAILYKNGAQAASDSFGAIAPTSSATATFCIGSSTADLARVANQSTAITCAWARELSAAEQADMDRDPYCFLIPVEGEMPALYLASSGIIGSASITLGALQVAGTGSLSIGGSASITLGALAVAGTGSLSIGGSGAIALGALVVAGAGSLSIGGSGAIVLGGLTVAGVGSLPLHGSGAIALGALQVAGVGSLAIGGAGAIVLGSLQVAGTGLGGLSGAGTINLGALIVDAAGIHGISGAGAIALGPLVIDAAGSGVAPIVPDPPPASRCVTVDARHRTVLVEARRRAFDVAA